MVPPAGASPNMNINASSRLRLRVAVTDPARALTRSPRHVRPMSAVGGTVARANVGVPRST
eukprot:2622203-Prymnesium_polylepis.1